MANIYHTFHINTTIEKVFEAISTPNGIDKWWSKKTLGSPKIGEEYHFSFGPDYNWTAIVTKYEPKKEFELEFVESDLDWNSSKVGFTLITTNNATKVEFSHIGWKEDNEHFRITNYCWAMYLRILKRYLEFGDEIPYEDRLNV